MSLAAEHQSAHQSERGAATEATYTIPYLQVGCLSRPHTQVSVPWLSPLDSETVFKREQNTLFKAHRVAFAFSALVASQPPDSKDSVSISLSSP